MNNCKAAVCGDGVVRTEGDKPEECDDGNSTNEDLCLNNCKKNTCGDGYPGGKDEQCDDGNKIDDDKCSNSCMRASCGDGKVNNGEQCDDGNKDNSDGCTTSCRIARCGDGYIWAGKEECDGPTGKRCRDLFSDVTLLHTPDRTVQCQNCRLVRSGCERCGDRLIQRIHNEKCDGPVRCTDPRLPRWVYDTPGRDAQCAYDCSGLDVDPCGYCGDYKVQYGEGEECDNGNNNTNGPCPRCREAFCGDGLIFTARESCDDGNTSNNDACVNCRGAFCGDGHVWQGREQCDPKAGGNGSTRRRRCDQVCKNLTEPKTPGGRVLKSCGNDCRWGGWRCEEFCRKPEAAGTSGGGGGSGSGGGGSGGGGGGGDDTSDDDFDKD